MKTIAPVLLLFLGGCGSLSLLHEARSGLPPNDTERRVEQTFQSFGIPIAEKTLDGRVRSGRFDPREVFAGQLHERVSCGAATDEGVLTEVRPFELEVLATIRSNRVNGTRVEIESYGKGWGPDGKEIPCQLSRSAVEAILDAASGAPADPRRTGSS